MEMINNKRASITLAQYKKANFPEGGPTLETLRTWIDDGFLDGYTIQRGKRHYYFVYTDKKCVNPLKVNDFLSQLE